MTSSSPRKRRVDAYISRLTISIELSPTDPNAYSNAVKAVDGLAAALPVGSRIEFASRSFGKIEAA